MYNTSIIPCSLVRLRSTDPPKTGHQHKSCALTISESNGQFDHNPWSRTRSKNLRPLRRIHIAHNITAPFGPLTPAGNCRRRTGSRLTEDIRIMVGFHHDSESIITSCVLSATLRPKVRLETLEHSFPSGKWKNAPILLATPPLAGLEAVHLSNKACAAVLMSLVVACAIVDGARRKSSKLHSPSPAGNQAKLKQRTKDSKGQQLQRTETR